MFSYTPILDSMYNVRRQLIDSNQCYPNTIIISYLGNKDIPDLPSLDNTKVSGGGQFIPQEIAAKNNIWVGYLMPSVGLQVFDRSGSLSFKEIFDSNSEKLYFGA